MYVLMSSCGWAKIDLNDARRAWDRYETDKRGSKASQGCVSQSRNWAIFSLLMVMDSSVGTDKVTDSLRER